MPGTALASKPSQCRSSVPERKPSRSGRALRMRISRRHTDSTSARPAARRNLLLIAACLGSLGVLRATLRRVPVTASAFSVTGDTWQTDYRGVGCDSNNLVTWVPCYEYLQTSSTLNGRSGWQTTAYWADSQWYAIDPNNGRRLVFSYEHDTSSTTGNEVYMNASDLGWCSTCSTNTLGYASWSTSGLWGNELSYVDIEITTNPAANWYVAANGGTIGSTQNSIEE